MSNEDEDVVVTSPRESTDYAMLLLRLVTGAGGRIDPARILRRKPESTSRKSFVALLDSGYVDGEGWVTPSGQAALDEYDRESEELGERQRRG